MAANQFTNASRRSVALSFKDGLWDVVLGSFFILLAIQQPLENQGLEVWASYMPSIVGMAVGVLIYYWLKRKLVTPRIGLVKASFRTNQTRRWMLLLILALQLITLLFFVLGYLGSLGDIIGPHSVWVIDAFFSLAIFGFFAYLAYTMDALRFYLYGFLLGLSPIMNIIFTADQLAADYSTLAAGVVMVVFGVVTFVSFLRKYTPVEQETTNG